MQRLSYAQKTCITRAGKTMQELAMIVPGARVGVAVSGGVDSFTLLEVLRHRQRIVPFRFDLLAIHLNPGFDASSHAPLNDYLARNGIAGHVELTDHGPRSHSDENRRRSPCFLCAMLRRTRLFGLCREYGLTHLAFGHNADDLVDTFFMNMVQNGRVDGLMAKDLFFGGRLTVIRPLITVEKAVIVKAAGQWGLPWWRNACPSAGKTNRTRFGQKAAGLYENDKVLKRNLYHALEKWQLQLTTPRKPV